jgi:hypothetical protein
VTEARFDPRRKRLEVDGWSARVTPSGDVDLSEGEVVRVSLHIRQGVNLVVGVSENASEVSVETWAGEPDRSDGLAIVTDAEGEPLGIARIPLDATGERGSSNAQVQLYQLIPAGVLPAVVDLLGQLPDLAVVPQRGRTWLGDFTDLPEPARRDPTTP